MQKTFKFPHFQGVKTLNFGKLAWVEFIPSWAFLGLFAKYVPLEL